MRMLSILLCFVMLVGLLPTTVFAAEKNKISEVEATATLPDKLYVGMNLYDPNLLETISFNTTKGHLQSLMQILPGCITMKKRDITREYTKTMMHELSRQVCDMRTRHSFV